VFVVGDAKQSIYRFRNADVTQFREIAEAVDESAVGHEASERDQLSTNFRTLPVVLETINALFDATFVEGGPLYEARPQRLRPHRTDPARIGSVEYLMVPTDAELRASRFEHFPAFAEATPDHDTDLEARALAARLSQVLAGPMQVYPGPDEEGDDQPRDITPEDIAILIRSRTNLKRYERALEAVGVPYSVASGIGFYDTPEVLAIINCLRALVNPGDERALYAHQLPARAGQPGGRARTVRRAAVAAVRADR
jgi:ATP-dependent helicase/nuclease subunit A